MKPRRRRLSACLIRHRYSRWSWIKTDDTPGFEPDIHDALQFRMCRNCGHQEIREYACA